jgi:hypothetical protein
MKTNKSIKKCLSSAWVIAMVALIGLCMPTAAQADTIWGHNAADVGLNAYDSVTGAELLHFTTGLGNGRGVVQVGNTLYVTTADSGNVYLVDATTGANLGTAFSIAGASGLSTMAYDGTNFWIGDYSGTNNAYLVSPTGTLLNTVSFVNCIGYCDGLEYFNGKLISNRFDGGYTGAQQYDIYGLDGTLLTAAFIDTAGHGNGTGIAYDGTNFWVSDIFNSNLTEWDGTTGAYIQTLALLGGNAYGIEDLSVNYATRPDTGGGQVPEPSSLLLLASGLLFLALMGKKGMKKISA